MADIFLSMANILLGVVLGIASSMLSWFVLFHVLVSKLRFSDYINRTVKPDAQGRYRYWLKYENYGRRGIVDVEFIGQLRIQGLRPRDKISWRLFYPKIQYRQIPQVPSIHKGGFRQLIEIIPIFDDIEGAQWLPEELKEPYTNGALLLEDLLLAGDNAELRIFAYGYDSFSGARKMFKSPVYKADSIKPYKYQLGSLDIDFSLALKSAGLLKGSLSSEKAKS